MTRRNCRKNRRLCTMRWTRRTHRSARSQAILSEGEFICQFVPLQIKATSSVVPEAVAYEPTATHESVEAHETPVMSVSVEPTGVGSVSIFHEPPFDLSASGIVFPEEFVYEPIATQYGPAEHEMAVSMLEVAPEGIAGLWLSHDEPFHASINGLSIASLPTAIHVVA
jgi:hypothetical protein